MRPETTALLLIEYQNDFVSDGGAQHDAVKAVMADTDMLAHSRTVLKQARAQGVIVMHAPISFAEGYPEIPSEPYGINWMRVPAYAALGQFTQANLLKSALLLPVALGSTYLGLILVRKFDAKRFYMLIYVLMILLGGKLVFEAL